MSKLLMFLFCCSLWASCAFAYPSTYLFGGSQPDGNSGQVLELQLSDGSMYLASTRKSPIGAEKGAENFGWWDTKIGHILGNYNYFAGYNSIYDSIFHNFFSFDLSGLVGTVNSATIKLAPYAASHPFTAMRYELFDVSTPAQDLLLKSGINQVIFSDLASGKSYGSFNVISDPSVLSEISISLSSSAIFDINNRRAKYFSIGGAVNQIPEPSTIYMLLLGMFFIASSRIGRKNSLIA